MDGKGRCQERVADSFSAPPGLVASGLGMQWDRALFVDITLPFRFKISTKNLGGCS